MEYLQKEVFFVVLFVKCSDSTCYEVPEKTALNLERGSNGRRCFLALLLHGKTKELQEKD